MSTSKIIKAYITDLNGNRITGTYISDTVTTLTYDGQTYTRNAQTGRSFAIAKDGDYFVAYLYNPDEAVSDGLVATFEGDLQWSDAPVLPTVSTGGDFDGYNWLSISSGGDTETVSSLGNSSDLKYGSTYPSYDETKSYGVILWRKESGFSNGGRIEFSIVNANGRIQSHNNTSGSLGFYNAQVAVCSSNQATVVTVYNSSNVAYNAFKFTANNTDYYYVLDGTQTDWTDDLASIGYSKLVTSYFRQDKDWQTLQTYNNLYDDNGNRISYQAGKTGGYNFILMELHQLVQNS